MLRICLLLLGLVGLSLVITHCQKNPDPVSPSPIPTAAPTLTPAIGVTFATLPASTSAVVQTTPTPLPTPTPTATPTPIIYTIEAGDTLLGIAIERQTTVAEIETMNAGINPRLLQIGQQIILPPPATPVFSGGPATPVPTQVEVIDLNLYETPTGGRWLLGEVINVGDLAVEDLVVEVIFYDAAGTALNQVTAWVVPGIVAAGEKAPFGLLVNGLGDETVFPVAAIISGRSVTNLGNRYLDLAVTATEVNIEENRVLLQGEVTNLGEAAAAQIQVIITLYDQKNRVAGYHQLTLNEPLDPQASQTFQANLTPPGGQVTTYTLSAIGIQHS